MTFASVLGVMPRYQTGPNGDDCDNADYGMYTCYGGSTVYSHYPSTYGGILISDTRLTISQWQIVIEEGPNLFVRVKRYSESWSSWKQFTLA